MTECVAGFRAFDAVPSIAARSLFPACFRPAQILTSEARLIGDQDHMLRLGFRESKLPFYRARMIFSDEMKSHSKRMEVRYQRLAEDG